LKRLESRAPAIPVAGARSFDSFPGWDLRDLWDIRDLPHESRDPISGKTGKMGKPG
jgi:hypothetical protein